MKRLVLFYFCFAVLPLYALEKSTLFVPRGDLPFQKYSPSGEFSIQPSDDLWPEVLQIETPGDSSNVQIVAQGLPEFSLIGVNQIFWIKVKGLENLKDLWLYASDKEDFSNRIVFMISSDPTQLREGEWCRISLPLSSGQIWGTPDLSKLDTFQIWVNDNGKGPASVQFGPSFLENDLPQSAVAITFDDGWKSQISTAAPLMTQYSLTGTAYVIPALIGTPGYMDIEDLGRLEDEYNWTVGSHYLEPVDGLSTEEMRALFEKQRIWFQTAGLEMRDFSYPGGQYNRKLLTVVSEYFRSSRTIIEFPESLPPGNPYKLRTLNVLPTTSLETIEKRVRGMEDKGELLILVFHKIEDQSQFETELPVSRFEDICRIISQSGRLSMNMEEISTFFPDSSELQQDQMTSESVFQPLKSEQMSDQGGRNESLPEDDPLAVKGPGRPGLAEGTQIDFSLDWKMAWGTLDSDTEEGKKGDSRFYNQLDDLHLYLQSELSDSARLFAIAGIEKVNFSDFSKGEIDGSYFYLNSLFLEQDLPADFSIKAGYMSPDPYHKWLQVTRSSGIEPAFGQDLTPQSIWIGGEWRNKSGYGVQAAAVPDFIGVKSEGSDINSVTYQRNLGVPNLFGSFWYDTERLDAELAVSINGSAVKIVSSGGYFHNFDPVSLAASAGVKYTKGSDFVTYPEWDHLDDALRLSTGVSLNLPVFSFTLNPGLAFQTVYYSGDVRNELGFDAGLIYKSLEFFIVFTDYDLSRTEWSDTLGVEAGVSLDYDGVEYIAGYTMAGFNAISGLYNNKDWNEGGVNGVFLRIKATYW